MKKLLLRLNLLILMLAVAAGIVIFNGAFMDRLPKNVTVNGVDVGGKSRAEAAVLVRNEIVHYLKGNTLTVLGRRRDYIFSYPEIGYKDNVQKLLKDVKRGGEYTAEVVYYLNGLGEVAANICQSESIAVVEPYAVFNSSGEAFTYFEGNDGERADAAELISGIENSLKNGFTEVTVQYSPVYRQKRIEEVKRDTSLLSSFTTYFDGDNADRSHNIRLAAEKINATVIAPDGGFSFNSTVGMRTVSNGFRLAKIIENGEFVLGVGGGVCQVSTTLFNAALLAGCHMTEFHPHSLAVSYVPPSFDAMVSGTRFDLKFENASKSPLYIRAQTGKNYVRFSIFGRDSGIEYGFSSVVTGSIEAPVETTSDPSRVKDGKDGVISEGYLTVTRNGIRKTTLFRRDKYAPVKHIVPEQQDIPCPKVGDAEQN